MSVRMMFLLLRFTWNMFLSFNFKSLTGREVLLKGLRGELTDVRNLKESQVMRATLFVWFNSYEPWGCMMSSCHHQLDWGSSYKHTVEFVTTSKLPCKDVIHECCLVSPACLDVAAGVPSPSVKYACASVAWQFLLTFGISALSIQAQDSVLSSPPHQGPGQIIKQEKCYQYTGLFKLKVYVFIAQSQAQSQRGFFNERWKNGHQNYPKAVRKWSFKKK